MKNWDCVNQITYFSANKMRSTNFLLSKESTQIAEGESMYVFVCWKLVDPKKLYMRLRCFAFNWIFVGRFFGSQNMRQLLPLLDTICEEAVSFLNFHQLFFGCCNIFTSFTFSLNKYSFSPLPCPLFKTVVLIFYY